MNEMSCMCQELATYATRDTANLFQQLSEYDHLLQNFHLIV